MNDKRGVLYGAGAVINAPEAPADDLVRRLHVTENKCIEAYSDSPSGDIDTALLAAIDDLREAADALASRDQRIAALTAAATQMNAHIDEMQVASSKLLQAAERRAEAAEGVIERLRKIEHLTYHLLDDNSEENATTGVTTLGPTDDKTDVWLAQLLPLFDEGHPDAAIAAGEGKT